MTRIRFVAICVTLAISSGSTQAASIFDVAGRIEGDYAAARGRVSGSVAMHYLVNNPESDTVNIEQANAWWNLAGGLGIGIGQFASELTWKNEGLLDLYQASHGPITDFYEEQISLEGSGVQGAMLGYNAEKLNVRIGYLGDIGGTKGKSSTLAVLSREVAEGLRIKGSVLTQRGQAGDLYDLNGTYERRGWTVGMELMTADREVRYGWSGTVQYEPDEHDDLTASIGHLEHYEVDTAGLTSYTLDALHRFDDGLAVLVEYRGDDDGKLHNTLLLNAIAMYP